MKIAEKYIFFNRKIVGVIVCESNYRAKKYEISARRKTIALLFTSYEDKTFIFETLITCNHAHAVINPFILEIKRKLNDFYFTFTRFFLPLLFPFLFLLVEN